MLINIMKFKECHGFVNNYLLLNICEDSKQVLTFRVVASLVQNPWCTHQFWQGSFAVRFFSLLGGSPKGSFLYITEMTVDVYVCVLPWSALAGAKGPMRGSYSRLVFLRTNTVLVQCQMIRKTDKFARKWEWICYNLKTRT